jgi:hypothetical protein
MIFCISFALRKLYWRATEDQSLNLISDTHDAQYS